MASHNNHKGSIQHFIGGARAGEEDITFKIKHHDKSFNFSNNIKCPIITTTGTNVFNNFTTSGIPTFSQGFISAGTTNFSAKITADEVEINGVCNIDAQANFRNTQANFAQGISVSGGSFSSSIQPVFSNGLNISGGAVSIGGSGIQLNTNLNTSNEITLGGSNCRLLGNGTELNIIAQNSGGKVKITANSYIQNLSDVLCDEEVLCKKGIFKVEQAENLSISGNTTLTAQQICFQRLINITTTGNFNLTLPTGAQVCNAIPLVVNNTSFEFIIRNMSMASTTLTAVASAGITLSGTMTIGGMASRHFKCIVNDTSSQTATIYSVGNSSF